jgi:thermitase
MAHRHRRTRIHPRAVRHSRSIRSSLVAPIALLLPLAGIAAAPAEKPEHELPAAPGRVLVAPRAGLSDADLEKTLKPHGGKSKGRIKGTDVHIVELPAHVSEKAVAKLLEKHEHLKFVELDVQLKPQASVNDPYFTSAWHLYQIQAPAAWDISTGRDVTIAILDSGVDPYHPDLAGKLVPGWNFFDNNADTRDVFGHGTLAAGSAAAANNNGAGVASVAGDARIMPIRVTDASGTGYLSQMAQGITWAADRGARVANLSFQGAGGFSTVQNAAQYMKSKGGLVVTAAGNYGRQETYAASDSVLVVSATDGADQMAGWSSYGSFVDIAAPGVGVWSTSAGGGYSPVSGTSFASPVTAGVVALIMAANPALSASDVENVLLSTAIDLGPAGPDMYYGRGRVNAAAAVEAARVATARDTSAPTVSITSPAGGATVKGIVPIDVSASDNLGVSRVELLVNGTPVATDTTAPYGLSWDSTRVPDGNATLVAYAYDAAGNYSSRSVTVKVANAAPVTDTVPPVASIVSPLPNTRVSGNITVQAKGTDNVAVMNLKLYIDGQLKSTANGGTMNYKWNTKQASSGMHTLKVEARDAAGNVATHEIQVVK